MANPHFQNLILNAGNTAATKHKKDVPMFLVNPSSSLFYQYSNDFMTYNSGDWTITTTEAGSGNASEALTSQAGGALLITNDDADNDLDFLQLKGESFKLSSSKRAYFEARFKVSDATQSDFVMGLQITDTTPLATTDGVFFIKDDGDTNLDFIVEKDSTSTDTTAIHTMVDDTFVVVGFFIDPNTSQVSYFINSSDPVGVVNTNLPDDEELTVSFGIQNGAAAAKTMTVDYVNVICER
jgi:hypothetical protein|tara:strand:- start:28 stop:744 length:717 start_codon:yes stop_codon:yes gene_type:complete